jgi:hypothetical protein
LDGPLPKLCPAVALSRQDGHHSAVALLLKAALIQVSDYRLLGASGLKDKDTKYEAKCKYSCAAILVRGRDHQTQIWFSSFRGEDLNVIFYQDMSNLHNRFSLYSRFFCEIFLSADIYRLCKLGIF